VERNYAVDFPALFVAAAWMQRHCVVPDGFRKGRPFRPYDWQLWITLNHYRVRDKARQDVAWLEGDPDAIPVRSEAFTYRRSQAIAPQKTGKGPWSAALVCVEAVGPALFYDWAREGDVYDCADHGCSCGWVYRYRVGEAMGHAWPTPLIQLLATSEDQVDNVYRPLQAMAKGERLKDRMLVREGFIRLPNDGRIDVVTSSAMSRLGNPITFCVQDESQLYTASNKLIKVAETMRRGAAAMGGRSIETTNCYDPSEQSVAQRTRESKSRDIFKFYEPPPADLKYTVKVERSRIHRYNYAGSPHADLHGIEAEAAELMEKDPGQAERFYGNRIVAGLGSWLSRDAWDLRKAEIDVPAGTQIVAAFDGSDVDDWTGFRCETRDGHQFTPTFADGRSMIWNPADFGGQVPRLEVSAALDYIVETYNLVRLYADPPYWATEIDSWAEKHGDTVILRWPTFRDKPMHSAAERLLVDVNKKDSAFTHDGCEDTSQHIGNARKAPRLNGRYVLSKPGDGRKIDMAVVSILAHEAHGDMTAAGWPELVTGPTYFRLPR
jgi:hypothetical protein